MSEHRPVAAGTLGILAGLALTLFPGMVPAVEDRFGGGADAKELPVAKDGACPPKIEIPPDCDFRCKRRLLRGAAPRQIVLKEVPVFEDVDLRLSQGGRKLSFGNKVKVTLWSRGRLGSHFVRYDTERGPRCGWVDPDAVLSERRGAPMRISELGTEGIADFKLSGKGSELDAKVLVRNEYEKGNADAGDGARVYYRFTDPEPHSTIRIFNVLNVYDYARHEGEVWYFVGGTRTTKSKGEEQVLYGWVRANEVIPWSTLVNVYYAEGKTGLEIYETDMDADGQTNAFARQGRTEGVAETRNIPRFPLLETLSPQDATLHEIAFPGTACDSEGNCMTARDLAEKRAEIGDEVWKASNIDFLFVIDATKSIVEYFPLVIRAVNEFLAEVEAEEAASARFSIVVYGDFLNKTSGREGFQFARPVPFGSANNARAMEKLKLMGDKYFPDNMADLPEAAFAALNKAIREADWRESAGWRMTIWIGDHPNRGGDLKGNREQVYSATDVVRALESVEGGVWAAVNVRGNYQPEYNDQFMEQADEIFKGFDGWGIDPRRAYESLGKTARESPAQIVKAVKEQLHGIMYQGKAVPEALAMKAMGATATEIERALPEAVLARRYVEERLSMSDSEVKDFFERSQLVRRGFVRQSDPPDPNWRYWVAFKPAHMREIVLAGQELCETLSDDAPDLDKVRTAMVATLKSITGDSPEEAENIDETLQRFLSKRLQVPVDHFSELLGKNIDGFVQWYMESKSSESEAFKVLMCKKAALLESAMNKQRVDAGLNDIEFDTGTNIWGPRKGTARKFNWLWKSEHGVGFYYIPLDYVL